MGEHEGRRLHRRHAVTLDVTVLEDGDEHPGVAHNVSLGGMFVALASPPAVGTEVTVRLRVPALRDRLELRAVVRWNDARGAGLSFGRLRAREVWALNELFRQSEER